MAKEKLTIEYIQKLHLENLQIMRSNLGSVIGSTVGDKNAYLTNCIETKYPRTIMYVYDMAQSKLTWHHGLELLGFSKLDKIGFFDIANRYHENQQLILWYQALRFQELFLNYRGQLLNAGIYLVSRRAIKGVNGNYWNCHYVGQAMDYDKNGSGVSYFSRWQLLNKYQGEGLISEFVYEGNEPEKYNPIIIDLNRELEKIKVDTFQLLGFSRMQREVLKYLAGGSSNKGVAETLEMTERAVEYHNEKILEIARRVFPINNFIRASNVAFYLRKQGLI